MITTDPGEATAAPRTYEQILTAAIDVLTEAARQTRSYGAGTDHVHHEQADFAEFVTLALAGAAANVGGIEALLAGRPGSWEADGVRSLLTSTVGWDEEHLIEHRTEPLTVVVNVDDLLNDLGYYQLDDDAEAELQRREDAVASAGGSLTVEQDDELDRIDALRDRLDEQRDRDWAIYGQAFSENVHRAAAALLPGLRVPVEVVIETRWQNDAGSDDPPYGPAFALWERARDDTPLPGSGIPLKDYPPGVEVAQVERDAGRAPLTRLENHDREGGESR
jgi:hypothetical protein